jgi:hypothetical protein
MSKYNYENSSKITCHSNKATIMNEWVNNLRVVFKKYDKQIS